MAMLKSKEDLSRQIIRLEYLLLLRNVVLTQLTVLLPKLQQLPLLPLQQLPALLAKTYGKPQIASKTRKREAVATQRARLQK